MILINFKIYRETFGEEAVKLARVIKEVSDKYKIRIVVAVSALDAVRIKETGAEVWLQDVDGDREGKATGSISMEQAMELGIKGSLINHSERQIAKGTVLKILKNRPKGFEIMCCAKSRGQIEKWVDKAKPDWILFEPPELIASKDKSVATENPEMIKRVAELVKNSKLMVGAGVKNRKDVEISLKMGAKGVGLSSAFVLASNPREVLEEIAEGYRNNQ
ncbi:MAG: triose-phosphate isomerase [Candidatus Shapirobacteria bacterium]|jgi:triosephosphate isomerase